jgi:Na+/panthothenate symporter
MVATVAQLVFGAYLVGVLLIGVYASRFTEHTPTDFYVANRSVGTVVLALTLAATVLSAFTVFGIGADTSAGGLGTFSFLAIAAVFYTLFSRLSALRWSRSAASRISSLPPSISADGTTARSPGPSTSA